MKRSRREHQHKYITMLEMFIEARVVTRPLEVMTDGGDPTGNIVDAHWDLLQVDHMNHQY